MITALIELPAIISKSAFEELKERYTDLDGTPNIRVYESSYGAENFAVLMGAKDYYRDEVTKVVGEDYEYKHGDEEVMSHQVHNRPSDEYVKLKDRYLLVDLEIFYSLVPSNMSVKIIRATITG